MRAVGDRPLWRLWRFGGCLFFSLFSTSAFAQERPVALVGGDVYPVSGPRIAGGTVVLHRGKIVAVGKDVEVPADARREDVRGMRVVPGFVDAWSGLGLTEIRLSAPTVDNHEGTGPIQAHLRAIDALATGGLSVRRARAGGVTTVHTVPGLGNVVGGTSAVWRLGDGVLPELLLASEGALHVSLGETPKASYSGKRTGPRTRMGEVGLLRAALVKAQDYTVKRKGRPRRRDLQSEVLGRALRREIPVFVHAHRVDDLLVALRIADEFGLRLTLAGAAEAWRIATVLAAKKVPVVVAPVRIAPDRMERMHASLENAAQLHKAGVVVAIGSQSIHLVATLPFEAGYARAYGLSKDAALRAVTLVPATLLGVSDRVGSLEVGKHADVVVVRGDPFEPTSKLERVYVGGEAVDLRPWEKR